MKPGEESSSGKTSSTRKQVHVVQDDEGTKGKKGKRKKEPKEVFTAAQDEQEYPPNK